MLRRARAEDLEGRRRAVLAGWIRQPVAGGESTPVALVANDGRAGTEHVAVAEPRAVEDPVTGAVHGVAAEPGGHVATYAVIAPAGERDAGHRVLRAPNDHRGPEPRFLRFAVGSHERVILEEALVPDHYVVIVALDSHLPQRRIAREERSIPAPRDACFDCVSHSARPVLVVADR